MTKIWYIMDEESNIINDCDGHENKAEAIEHFKKYMGTAEAAEGCTLCLLLEEDGSWIECLEELTPDEIFE